MGDERSNENGSGLGGIADGLYATQATEGTDISFRQGIAVLQPCISKQVEDLPDDPEHEQERRLLGQRTLGIIFQNAEK